MFKLKKVVAFGFMALLLGMAMAIFPTNGVATAHAATASVAAASCTYNGCDHKSPVSTSCQDTAVIERSDSGTIDDGIGVTIQLQFSTACHAAWAREVFSRTLPSGYDGYAELYRITDGADVECSSSGGDGNVLPGQSICYTPMLGDGPSQSTAAFGWYCDGNGCNAPVDTSSF
jgi:hypothetical protein